MFLKSVEIFGFKSFAERTLIEFREGVSALLGPNGCGKSNVVDAIKWVLGEQATKSLRAEKMQDVIFNGSEARKKVNVAEVTLVISNEQNLLLMDLAEISIKRRLYRSGESEYYINNAHVKLKDVRELFMDTGIGKSAYSVMEQGQISQVLSNKPEERRYLFEEAAGITKFKMRQIDAERKLQRTTENMNQVENILAEVKKTHDNLKRQSEKTVKYREYSQRVFDLELDLQLLRLKALNETDHQKSTKLNEVLASQEKINSSITELDHQLEEQMGAVNNMQSKVSEAHKEIFGIGLEKQSIDNQVKILKEQITDIDQQIAIKVAKEQAIRDKQKQLDEDIESLTGVLSEFDERLSDIEENLKGFRTNIENAELKIRDNELEIGDMNRLIRETELLKEDLATEIQELTGDIVSQLDESLSQSGYSSALREKSQQNLLDQVESFRIHLESPFKILQDAGDISDSGMDRIKKLVKKAKDGFEESLNHLGTLKSGLDDFFNIIPVFIDDFIAPEGIITQKRKIDDQIKQIKKKAETCRDRVEELTEENLLLNDRIREYRSTLNNLKENQLTLEKQRAAFETQLGSALKERENRKNELDQISAEIEVDREKQNQINIRIEDSFSTKNTLVEKEVLLQEQLKSLESEIRKNNSSLADNEKSLKKYHLDLLKNKESAEKLQMALVSIHSDIANCFSNFRDHHSRDLSEFESRMFEINTPVDKLKEILSKTRENLRGVGQVNLMAPEEYEEVKERYDFLNNQLEDLKNAKDNLNRISEQIITESTDLFLETFKQIHKNFHVMFRRLFGGGRGELRLTNADDILNSGIDIFAQPPGKSLENISLLSGGEKSMTAVALLFATYQVRPAPFCILDEIDAALDEANVGRFTNVLIEFSEKSQFIVITHNKKTVTSAKTLIGVTMQESGISTVISVRLSSDNELEVEGDPDVNVDALIGEENPPETEAKK